MLGNNILQYIKLREKMTMEEIEKNQQICEADAYILEIGYHFYLERMSLDVALEKIKNIK